MSLARRIKRVAMTALSSKPVSYEKVPVKKQVKLKVVERKTTPPSMRQYGDKGYRPSTGRNVGP